MNLFTSGDMPYPLKVLIWVALGIAALVAIWKNLQGSRVLQIVAREMTSNHGDSIKDKVNQAAEDSKEALDLTKKLEPQVRAVLKHQKVVDQELSGVREALSQVKTVIARQIIHTANNDLHTSNLLKEEQRLIGEEEKMKGKK